MERLARLLAVVESTGVAFAVTAAEVKVVKAGQALDSVKVVRDKDTGKLRNATPEEIEELGKLPNVYAPNVVVLSRPATTSVTHPDGSATIRRSIEDLDSLTATRGADGKLVIRHKGTQAPSTQTLPKE